MKSASVFHQMAPPSTRAAADSGGDGFHDLVERFATRGSHDVLQEVEGDVPTVMRLVQGWSALVVEGRSEPFAVVRGRMGWSRVEFGDGRRRWMSLAGVRRLAGDGERRLVILGSRTRAATMRAKSLGERPSPLARTIQLLHLERQDIGVVMVYGVAIGLLSLAVPVAAQSLVNTVAFGSLIQPLVVLTALLAVALLTGLYLRALRLRVVEMLQRRVFVRVVTELSDRLPRVHVDAFVKSRGPELLNRFFDVFTTQKTVSSLLLDGIDATLVTLVGMTVLAFYHPILLAFDLTLIAAAVVVFWGLGRGGTTTSVNESKAKYAVASWLEEVARHPLSFRLAGGAAFARRRMAVLAGEYLTRRDAHFRVVFRQFLGALAMQVVASVALLAIGGALVIGRELSLGQLVASELIVTAVVAAIAKLGGKVEVYYDLLAAVDKLGDILDLPVEEEDESHTGLRPRAVAPETVSRGGTLEVEHLVLNDQAPVSFRLDRGGALVLERYSAEFRHALADVLYGLRPPPAATPGTPMPRLTVHGLEQRDISVTAWRSLLALVRDHELLPCSVADNVRAANPDLEASDIWHVLESVDLAERVRALPNGLDTMLGPALGPLTRSEATRLTIARAIAARPSFLVLDGALEDIEVGERLDTMRGLLQQPQLGVVVLTGDLRIAEAVRDLAGIDTRSVPPGGLLA